MAVLLKRALMEILTDWPDDLAPEWRDACGEVELGFGNADPQRELDKMFSNSVRALIQQIVAARTGDSGCARDFADWVDDGVLLHNATLTLSRFRNQRHRETRRGAMYADPDWQRFIGEISEIEAILAQDVMIVNPARFAPAVAMAGV
jgi:hypothetical protein